MSKEKAGLAIRTAYNNQGWAGRCKKPLSDPKCFKCVEGGLFINWGEPITEDENGYCKGNPEDYPLASMGPHWCWEQLLCKKFFWGNVKGQWRKAWKGMPVYFLYANDDHRLTLWGHSTIERIVKTTDKYPPIFFERFEPLPENKWIGGLTGEEVTGEKWGSLHFRYLDKAHNDYLMSLLEGEERSAPTPEPKHKNAQGFGLRKDIIEKLEEIAIAEGRDTSELVREAVAKLIRERGY